MLHAHWQVIFVLIGILTLIRTFTPTVETTKPLLIFLGPRHLSPATTRSASAQTPRDGPRVVSPEGDASSSRAMARMLAGAVARTRTTSAASVQDASADSP